ncbi:MAG: hypothetical protein ACJ8F1_00175 [Polyangia bacterium]
MAATALTFLLAVGGGAALADSASGAKSQPQQTQAKSQGPVGFAEEEVTSAPLTVERVDKKNRNVVLRAADGTQSTVDIPSGTPGFDSLKKGDKVQLDYFAAAVFGPGNQQQGNRANANSGNAAAGNASQGKVRNIRKVDDTGNTGHSGTTSGSDQGNR